MDQRLLRYLLAWTVAGALVVAAAGCGGVKQPPKSESSPPNEPHIPAAAKVFHGPDQSVTDALIAFRVSEGADRLNALQQAIPLLRAYLADPDCEGIVGPEDSRLPEVTFLLSGAEAVRVVTLDGGAEIGSLNRGYGWIQWWQGDQHRLQVLSEGGPVLIVEAAVVNGQADRILVIKSQVLQPPWTQSVSAMRLNDLGDKWVKLTEGFAGLPTTVGTGTVDVKPDRISATIMGAKGTEFFLKDGGNTLEICDTDLPSTCVQAVWDTTGYRVQ